MDAIVPTPLEERIFVTLTEAAKWAQLGCTLRCAGGWVRDKLLAQDTASPDIDVALDEGVMGAQFAAAVSQYLVARGEPTSGIGVIKSNPDQSKHLETATMRVHGIEIDFVNLRSETYADSSRIPEATVGTPQQDAERRDLTINALFYNLNTRAVEDWTGRGLADLKDGVLRTPLPPLDTFREDPLRVLRAIRFAARFSFRLDSELEHAAAEPVVREALMGKVSRERIGIELEKMITGPDPVAAVTMLVRLRLFPTVFAAPSPAAEALRDDYGTPCLAALTAAHALLKESVLEEERRLACLASLLLPLRQCTLPGKKGPLPLTEHIVAREIKWRAKDGEHVVRLHQQAPELLRIARALQDPVGERTDVLRVDLARAIRQLEDRWRVGCTLAAILPDTPAVGVDAASREEPDSAAPSPGSAATVLSGGDGGPEQQLQWRLALIQILTSTAVAWKLDRAWQIKPILDGKAVQQAAGLSKPGPLLGKLTKAVLEWQFAHPDGTADECRMWLEQNHASLK